MLIVSASACQGSSVANGAVGQAVETQAPETINCDQIPLMHGFRREYKSLEQLAKDATIVVRGAPTSESAADDIGAVEFTVQTLEVVESFKGSAVGASVKVQQIGGASMRSEERACRHLQVGKEYILFLTPVDLPGKADQYSVTGGSGMFRFDAASEAKRVDAESQKLPKVVTVESVRKAVAAQNRSLPPAR
jgi:hypothetical protein